MLLEAVAAFLLPLIAFAAMNWKVKRVVENLEK